MPENDLPLGRGIGLRLESPGEYWKEKRQTDEQREGFHPEPPGGPAPNREGDEMMM